MSLFKSRLKNSALFKAVSANNFEAVEKSLKPSFYNLIRGANVNAKNKYETPLYIACLKDNLEVAEFLISKVADVNAKKNETPLFNAYSSWKIEIAELLINKGADVKEKDKYLDNVREKYFDLINKKTHSYIILNQLANSSLIDEETVFSDVEKKLREMYYVSEEDMSELRNEAKLLIEIATRTVQGIGSKNLL